MRFDRSQMSDSEHTRILFLKYTYQESKEGRAYLKACHKHKQRVSENPEFWAAMYDDSKLSEEPCLPKSPRLGPEYQCDTICSKK